MKEVNRELFDIDTSIVYVIGLSEVLYNFQLLFDLKNCFEEKGYKAALFTDTLTKDEMDDVYSLHEYLDPEISSEKLVIANRYMKEIEITHNYDLFLVGIEKGTVSFGREILEDMGLTVYSISRILHLDCVVLQIFWGDYEKEDIKKIEQETEQILGEEIDFINIRNKAVDLNESLKKNEIISFEIEKKLVDSTMRGLKNECIFALDSQNEIERLTEAIITRLQNYVEIERV